MSFVNMQVWKKRLESTEKKLKMKANTYVRLQVKKVLVEALKVSPQWSGNYAISWQLVTNIVSKPRYDEKFKVDPWHALRGNEKAAGDPDALEWNLEHVNKQVLGIRVTDAMDLRYALKWNSNVKLVNMAPVHQMIEDGTVNLRPENSIPGGAGVIAHLKARFKFVQ